MERVIMSILNDMPYSGINCEKARKVIHNIRRAGRITRNDARLWLGCIRRWRYENGEAAQSERQRHLL